MRSLLKALLVFCAAFGLMLLVHLPLLGLPYYWDEAGYYLPAAMDFYRAWRLVPSSTLAIGHTPLVMVYLSFAWRLLGFSPWVTRAAMTLIAAGTLAALYALGRRVATREIAAWSALLLALSPLFFAQSALAHLDLAAALFTTWGVLALLGGQPWLFALAASLAILSKETALVLLPAGWLYAGLRMHRAPMSRPAFRSLLAGWTPLLAPLIPLAAWAVYYHHATGFWTGNRVYLSYNVYSTLSPPRFFWSLLRRVYELFGSGFNWLLTIGAMAGIWWGRRHEARNPKFENRNSQPAANFEFRDSNFHHRVVSPDALTKHFLVVTSALVAVYLLLLSVVGGAILPRYLLPVKPVFYLAAVAMIARLPRRPARVILGVGAACFVGAWFVNPPYPFPFEDNLAYADFIRLHQEAGRYLEAQPAATRILTAWPATDELSHPYLGYVHRPLRVVPVEGFSLGDLARVPPGSFELLYLYSRRWEPPGNWVKRWPWWLRLQGRYFDYHPQADAQDVAARLRLRMLVEMQRRGQWVRIYRNGAIDSIR